MHRGKYIVIEGAGGVGKTTMVQRIAQQLRAAQLPVKVMREPDSQNDLTARAIRHLTQDPQYPMNTRTEVLLYNAARAQSLQVIHELTESGVTCLVDRSYLTTLAIQYYGRGDIQDYQKMNDIIDFAVGDIQPDLMIVLDAPASTLRERAQLRAGGERFDYLDEAFLERVRAGYLWEAKQRNLPVVYATDDVDTVFKNVWQHVATALSVRDKDTVSKPQSIAEVLAANPPSKATAVESPTTEQTGVSPTAGADSNQPLIRLEPITQLVASGLRQGASSHTTDYTQRDSTGHHPYHTPSSLKGKLRTQYAQTMDRIFELHSRLVADMATYLSATSSTAKKQQTAAWRSTIQLLANDAARYVLPLAATTTITTRTTAPGLENTTRLLLGEGLPEAQAVGQYITTEARKSIPTFLDFIDITNPTVTPYGALQQLAQDLLPAYHTAENEAVTLVSYTPHNEFDIIPDILYAHSDMPFSSLQTEVAIWPYQRKADMLKTHLGNPKSHQSADLALAKVRYTFDLVCDFATYDDLVRNHPAASLQRQTISPRMGYDVPKQIEDASLTDAYEQCFDLSLQLYSALQGKGHKLEAQYAALLGHKLRWQVTYSARDIANLLSHQDKPGANTLVQQMWAKLAEAHPLLAEATQPTG